MKINFADIPVNVLDGFDKYPYTTCGATCYLLGFLTASLLSANWVLIFWALGGGFAGLVAAYYAGKPK